VATIFLFKIETFFIHKIMVEFPPPFITLFSKMSFADASFVIHYSRPEYDSSFVKQTLETIFGFGFIEQVREILITPTSGAPMFKKFYIYTIDDSHPALMRISDLIHDYKFAAVVYKYEYDRKTRKYADRYWKITHAPQWKTFTPYLMNEAQMEKIVPIEPWAPEADAAFAPVKEQVDTDDEAEYVCNCPPCRLGKTTITYDDTDSEDDMPPLMERDNDEPKGPYKMVRSVNSPPEPEDKPNEATITAEYWSDYWKSQGPAPLVRSTNAPKESECIEPKMCAWKDIPPPPRLFDWATREEYREK
jgi:hypothetical protein